jgi:hypothetical protein
MQKNARASHFFGSVQLFPRNHVSDESVEAINFVLALLELLPKLFAPLLEDLCLKST